ncbi:MAG: class II aldolase/adducin family protein [Bacteroidetes bacterium]|nr:class II aldolase/adducin family protein [Bacteroidota bacterium]
MLAFDKKTPARQLVEVMSRIYRLQLTTPSGGNLSVIDNEGNLWVTPSQIDKGRLTEFDMVLIRQDGSVKGKYKPTMEYQFHQGIYEVRDDIKAVAHAHPSGLVTYSLLQEISEFDHIPVLTHNILPIGFAPYALPGSKMLGDNIQSAFINGEGAVFMQNHGIITAGKNLLESFYKLENLELMANIYINALQLGDLLPVPTNYKQVLYSDSTREIYYSKKIKEVRIELEKRYELLSIIKRSYERKLINSSNGCFSIRISKESFIITPANFDIEYIEAKDLIKISDASIDEIVQPSHYWKTHMQIYERHQDINSICCSHAANIMAFAISAKQFETRTIPESYLILNEISKVSFEQYYQDSESIARIISNKNPTVIIENDCFLVCGTTPFQVFDRMEVAEFTARSIIYSGVCGRINMLKNEDIEELKRYFGE